MKVRLIILLAIILIWGSLACALSRFAPPWQARVTTTPTRTPRPTFTFTPTPTITLTPSATPTPTHTPTPTPTPTFTPLPTDTPLPTATPTFTPLPSETPTLPPSATPTATKKPAPKPTARPTNTPVPKPTSTPLPPYVGTIVTGWPNCGTKGVMGRVDAVKKKQGAEGVRVGVWSDAWQGRVSGPSDATGKYEINISDLPAGKFYVSVVNPDTCGQRDGDLTAVDCRRLSNVITVEIFEITDCNRPGTVQWSQVDFNSQ